MIKIKKNLNTSVRDLAWTNPFWPWLLFVIANGLLAYSPLGYQIKIWIFLVGIFAPLVLYAQGKVAGQIQGGRGTFKPQFAELRPWIWLLPLAAGVFLRFYKLTGFRPWPGGDEGLQGFFAIELVKKWDWRFFYTSGQHPPLLIWVLKFFFKSFADPFFNLWFPPAFFSTLALSTGYLACKSYLPKTTGFIFFLLLSLSFWPMDFGRFCVQGALVPFLEFLCFYFFNRFLSAKTHRTRALWAWILGLCLGLGCLTFTSWVTVMVFVFLLVVLQTFGQKQKDFGSFSLFLAAFLVGFSPWLVAVIREGYGGYVLGISAFSGFFTWKQQFLTSVSSFTSLFWGPIQTEAGYGPTWGGALNPVLGGCCFLGAVEIYRNQSQPFSRALALAFVLFLAPGFLAADHVEMFRIIPVMPILLVVTTFGIQRLLGAVPSSKRVFFLAVLIGTSFLVDGYHLWRPHLAEITSSPGHLKGPEDEGFQAYQILREVDSQEGPGLIFTEFLPLSRGHNLRVAVFSFNAADNPKLDPSKTGWAAVITNVHYKPFLEKRFPGSRWQGITSLNEGDGGFAVGIIPLQPGDGETMSRWLRAQDYVHQLGVQSENMMNNREFYQSILARLSDGYSTVEGDPFLESIYGEWVAQYHYTQGLDGNIAALQRAIVKGYPAANLYYKLGNFLFLNRQYLQARKAYLMAATCNPNYTSAKEVLARLWGGKI